MTPPQPTGNFELHKARGGLWSGMFMHANFYKAWGATVVLTALGIIWMPLMYLGLAALLGLFILTGIEYAALSRLKPLLLAGRRIDQRLSLGDDNLVAVIAVNKSNISLKISLLEELPVQLQRRDFGTDFLLGAESERTLNYNIHPTTRGVYEFGELLLFVGTRFNLVQRRYAFGPATSSVAVYPSVFQMKQQALRVRQLMRREGSEIRVRRFGRSYEFDQIKDYVPGDDYRQLNWKATARANHLMLNTFVEERSQQIVALVDTSRTMLSPFDGLSLLDYAVNSTLALLNVALMRGDRVGLLGFDKRVHTMVPAAARPEHLRRIMEVLYHQEATDFEPDYSALYQYVRREVKGRSLLMLYTSFDTLVSLERNLPALRQLARMHLLVVVMFINDKVAEEFYRSPSTLQAAYMQTIAAEYESVQARIAATLTQAGILVMRTRPEDLTANAVSQYLDVKGGGRL